MTIQQAKQKALEKIKETSPTPELDSRVILSFVLNLNSSQLIINYQQELTKTQEEKYLNLINQRANHVPVAYLIKEKEFYGRNFAVNENTLIPRPDTEVIVSTAIEYIKKQNQQKLSILDLCTGTGCIGISIAAELEEKYEIDLTLADISEKALKITKKNSILLKKTSLIIKRTDLFTNLDGNKYGIIVANPPYLKQIWMQSLEEDVKKEPSLALFGKSEDGLFLINQILDNADKHLEEDGAVFIECDYRQVNKVKQRFIKNGFTSVKIEKDLNGLGRVVWSCMKI